MNPSSKTQDRSQQRSKQQTKESAAAPIQPKNASAKRKLTEWERLAVVAMDAYDYLRRQHVDRDLVRFISEERCYVRVAYARGCYLVVVPSKVADILARKGIHATRVYAGSEPKDEAKRSKSRKNGADALTEEKA